MLGRDPAPRRKRVIEPGMSWPISSLISAQSAEAAQSRAGAPEWGRHAGSLTSRSSNNRAPAGGAHVRRGQLDCCDGLHGEGCVVSAAGVQAALLADVGAADWLRAAPCAAPCKRPILGHGSLRISSLVQAASNRLLFDCHRWRYDTQFCETAKQDGFGGVLAPKPGPGKASRQTLFF